MIGGGSGGLACAKRAASYNAKVAVIEGGRWGGTCVNVGCVPKKVMFNASHVAETIKESKEFGFSVNGFTFDWKALKTFRDRYIQRLNGIYESGLDKLNITRYSGMGSFKGPNTIEIIDGDSVQTVTSKDILIAVGGTPKSLKVPGSEHAIDSNGFFLLEEQPKKAAVIGAGYIAVELAGVLNGLGTTTSLFTRKENALRHFDPMLGAHLDKSMRTAGINVEPFCVTKEIVKEQDGTITLHFEDGRVCIPMII